MKKTVLFFMFLVIGITVFPNSIKYYEKAKIIDTVSIVKPGETEMDLIQKENMASFGEPSRLCAPFLFNYCGFSVYQR